MVEGCVLALAVAQTLLVLGFFLFVDLDGTVRGTLHPFSLVFAALWIGPAWMTSRVVRRRELALGAELGLLAITSAFLVTLFDSTHSTAGIGAVGLALQLYAMVGCVAAIDSRVFDGRRNLSTR